jgi:chromate transport protein ChrA
MPKKYRNNFLQKGLKFVSKNMKQKAWDFILLSSLCLLILGSIFMLPLKAVVFVFLVLINGVIYAFYRSQKKTKKKKQEQKIYFRDIEFLSPQAKQKILDGSLICAFLVLIIASIFMLHWESVFIISLLILNIFLYASYRYSISVPFASRISKKYVKKNFLEFSRINEPYFKTRLLYYLTLLVR